MLDYNKDGSFYGDPGECKKTLEMDLVWIESGKIPLLYELKQLN